jgi:RNA polymerase sigma-70 factor (ECF subfamily)
MSAPPTTTRTAGEGEAMDDRALVEALRSGDPQAPRVLIERFQGVVFGLCVRMMGHRHDAEDVVQEVFLRALRSVSGFDGTRPLRPWLLGIAANRCRTALAGRKRRPGPVESAEDCVDRRGGLADPDDLAGELERALGRLRPEYRLVFALYHEQGLAYEEIAQSVGRPVGTVKTWLHRARGELAEDLARRGVRC